MGRLMDLKRAAALVVMLFAAWEGYVAVLYMLFLRVNWPWMMLRVALILAIVTATVMTFRGRSSLWLAVAAFGALAWEARNIAFVAPGLAAGVWNFAWSDWSLFVPMFSPPLSLLLLLIAEGRGRRFLSLIRSWRPPELN
jgi:hypothetical protein